MSDRDVVIRVEGVSKLYRLGEVGAGSLAHDFNRWWHRVRGKEDPYLKVGEVNDRTKPAARGGAKEIEDGRSEIGGGEAGEQHSVILKNVGVTNQGLTGEGCVAPEDRRSEIGDRMSDDGDRRAEVRDRSSENAMALDAGRSSLDSASQAAAGDLRSESWRAVLRRRRGFPRAAPPSSSSLGSGPAKTPPDQALVVPASASSSVTFDSFAPAHLAPAGLPAAVSRAAAQPPGCDISGKKSGGPKASPSDWVYALKDVSFEVRRGWGWVAGFGYFVNSCHLMGSGCHSVILKNVGMANRGILLQDNGL